MIIMKDVWDKRVNIFNNSQFLSCELLWLENKTTLFREYYCNQTESVTGSRILKVHLKRGDLSFHPVLNYTRPQICCAPSGTYGSRIYVFIFRYIIITNYDSFCNYSDFWLKVVLNIYIIYIYIYTHKVNLTDNHDREWAVFFKRFCIQSSAEISCRVLNLYQNTTVRQHFSGTVNPFVAMVKWPICSWIDLLQPIWAKQ